MRISTTPNATPQSTPPSSAGSRGGTEDQAEEEPFVSLLRRLVHPVRLQILETLAGQGGPLSANELATLVPHLEGNVDLARYHAKAMIQAGVLEVVAADRAQATGRPGEPAFFLALAR